MAKEDDDQSTKKASRRLAQVASHLSGPQDPTSGQAPASSPKQRRSRRTDKSSILPAGYSDILGQLDSLKQTAATPDLNRRGYVRQKQSGKLWVRERVDQLLDNGSLKEVGSASGTVTWKSTGDGSREEPDKFTPSNAVQGFGKLNGRDIVFTADDYSIRAGHHDGASVERTLYIEKLSLGLRLPIVKLVDGSSGGGSVTTIKQQRYSYIPPVPSFELVVKQLNAGIPNLGAVLGPAIGLGAARVTMCHFSVMGGAIASLFNAGPRVVAGATFEERLTPAELGGSDIHCRNGTIDNFAANETDAFQQIRTVLSYLPNSGESLPPVVETSDPASRQDELLRSIIPRRKERMYDPRKIIATVVDSSSWFEIGPLWGLTVIVGLARLHGRPVGIISNNCESQAGALDAAGSQKINKHLKFCDVMNLPILQFVDVPGYAIGTQAERSGTMRHGVNLAATYFTTTTSIFSVITRRVYGVAGGVMMDAREPRMRIAWPSSDWGSLPLEGGIEASHSAELRQAAAEGGAEAAKNLYSRLEKEYRRLMNPVRTANAFGVEEIVDPAHTRPIVCTWAKHVYEHLLPIRLQERSNGKISPQFA